MDLCCFQTNDYQLTISVHKNRQAVALDFPFPPIIQHNTIESNKLCNQNDILLTCICFYVFFEECNAEKRINFMYAKESLRNIFKKSFKPFSNRF